MCPFAGCDNLGKQLNDVESCHSRDQAVDLLASGSAVSEFKKMKAKGIVHSLRMASFSQMDME